MATHSDSLPGFFRNDRSNEKANSLEGREQTASATTGGDLGQEPVVVWEAANRMEAQIVKGRLESEDIPALIRGEVLGDIYGLTTGGLASTDVLVPAPLADKAIALLATNVVWDDAVDDIEDSDKE